MTTVDTTPYRRSHTSDPRGYAAWIFTEATTGEVFEVTATYSAAVRALPAGAWRVCP